MKLQTQERPQVPATVERDRQLSEGNVQMAASVSLDRSSAPAAAAPSEDLLADFAPVHSAALSNIGRNLVAISVSHEGETDGMGYTIEHVQPGRGFSCHEYGHKEMPNGRRVERTTFHPGPFDAAAGLPSETTEAHRVWVGWGREGSEAELPPLELPEGAVWDCRSFDGPVNWYAEFEDGEKAEAYASSLPALPADDLVAPFGRGEPVPPPVFDPTNVVCQADDEVASFTKVSLPNGWMGNMSPHRVEHEGWRFSTTEALFHCLRFQNHPIAFDAIRCQASPMAAKMVSRKYMPLLSAEELSHDDDYMRLCLKLKVEQHPDLKMALLATGDKTLVEDVTARPSGKRWGAALENGQWVGANKLGALWMELRSELRTERNRQPDQPEFTRDTATWRHQ